MSNEWVAVIGRFTPLGRKHRLNINPQITSAVLLAEDGTPLCEAIKLTRIVNPAKEQAEKEFLDLTDGL